MTKLFSILKSSVLLQFVVLLPALYLGLVVSLPRLVHELQPNVLDSESFWRKVPEFFGSSMNPDVVIMGSSVMLAPAIRCDSEMLNADKSQPVVDKRNSKTSQGSRAPNNDLAYKYEHGLGVERNQIEFNYTGAKYFERLLNRAYDRELSVYNLSFPGVMASDNCLLFEELLDTNKRPAFIVLGVAARDLISTSRPDPEKSALIDEVRKFHKERRLSLIDHVRDLPKTIFEQLEGKRKNNVAIFKYLAAEKIGLWKKDGFRFKPSVPEPGLQADQKTGDVNMTMYQAAFNPPDKRLLQAQLQYLDRMLARARAVRVPIVVVNMPVTEAHRKLLNDDLRNSYEKGVQELATRYGCTYLDFDKPGQYQRSDFKDSLHLNAQGGCKLYAELVEELKSSQRLSERIAASGAAIY